jgi:hypothetical protein
VVDTDAGHGMASTKLQPNRERTDQLAVFYWRIGKAVINSDHSKFTRALVCEDATS